MAIKAILADLDGTLVNACDWHYIALNKALQEVAGTVISRTEHDSAFNGLPTRDKMAIMIRQGRVRPEDVERINQRKQELTVETIEENARPDDVKILLYKFLKERGLEVACVTNCSRPTAELMLEKTGQLGYMKFLVCNEDVRNPKPHPEPFIRAMIRLGHEPQEYLVIEDSERGIRAANLTGAEVMHVMDANEVTRDRIESWLKKGGAK